MSRRWTRWAIGAITITLIIIYGFTFTLYEGNAAMVTRFGASRAVITEAGLHWKLPMPFERAHIFDTRKVCYDTSHVETLTKDKKMLFFKPM